MAAVIKRRFLKRLADPRLSLTLVALVGVVVAAIAAASGVPDPAAAMLGIAVLMALSWVLEIVPIPVTSLFPLVLLPLFGIAGLDDVGRNYGRPVIFLFLGGFLLALALQRSQLHRRIALNIVSAVGSHPVRLVLGFMLATAFLSMWISNTASVLVMMPIGLAVLREASDGGVERRRVAKLGTALMLGIAYAADIGGMATLVGTPPNLVLLELQSELTDHPLSFGSWMVMGLPLGIVFLVTGWWLLTRIVFRFRGGDLFASGSSIDRALRALGSVRRDEWIVGVVFALTALAWVTGSDLQLGSLHIPGWRSLLGMSGVGDASVAIAAAALLFAIPSRDHEGEHLLEWRTAKRVPWGLLLLFGGGFALADGFARSGLSEVIGTWTQGLAGLHPVVMVLSVCLILTFMTEVTSNTATTALVLPILAQTATSIGVDPLLLMIPATLSASCAFMMPVASPTQAIVFGSGYVTIRQMVRAGIWFNFLGIILVTTVFMALAGPVFGVRW